MPNFPVATLMDTVIGVDFHTVLSPVLAPMPMVPHPYAGMLMLWNTPQFPTFSGGLVLVNGMPACSVGAMGLSVHVPMGLPAPPAFTNLLTYWRHHIVNIPKALGFMMKMIFVNLAIAGLSAAVAAVSKKDGGGAATANFMFDVAGIDDKSRSSAWDVIKASFSAFTQWQTYVHLLLPPVPYPGGQGSTAIGSPTVTVNGGHLAFVGPLVAASCSEIPCVPNGLVLGTSNVRVGVSIADLIRAISVQAVKGAITFGVQEASKPPGAKPPGANQCSG